MSDKSLASSCGMLCVVSFLLIGGKGEVGLHIKIGGDIEQYRVHCFAKDEAQWIFERTVECGSHVLPFILSHFWVNDLRPFTAINRFTRVGKSGDRTGRVE